MNDHHLNKIRELDCWQGELRIVELSGGITNKNYFVEDDVNHYVARLCEDRRHLGIHRDNERICQQAAQRAGVAPAVLHFESDLLVTQFIKSRTLTVTDLSDLTTLTKIASSLRQLHTAQEQHVGEMLYFCPFQTVRTYAKTASRLNARLPAEMDMYLEDAKTLSREITPFSPAMCHNDLLAANLLDDGKRLWIVDWEYAGVGNPLFDIASISANGSLSNEAEAHLLREYAPDFNTQMLHDVKVLKVISLLREGLWALIQSVASDIEFDYDRYAQDNLTAYSAAKDSL